MSTYIALLSFIYSIKSSFLMNLGVAAAKVSVRGRAVVAAEEEASVEAAMEETGSSGIDDGGGDRRNRERLSREWHLGDRRGLRVLG
jgi:hypothetical protein